MPSRLLALLTLVTASSTGVVRAEIVELFNGKDLNHWTYFLNEPDAKMEDVWSVDDEGVLVCKGKPIGYLRTKKPYENYRLTLQWRWKPGGEGGNSGVLLHTQEPDKVWPKSLEAQLYRENAGDIWVIDGATVNVPNQKARSEGRRILNLSDGDEKPLGEWNTYDILCKDGKITLTVNGKVVNDGTDANPSQGFICLQSEGTEIHFRDIRLEVLDD